jgi:predicted DCC family thiol-disulfide oxidoreductase YuxK
MRSTPARAPAGHARPPPAVLVRSWGVEPVVFYDGECGLCQRAVRLLVRLDRQARLRFAPLGGETFARTVPEAERRRLPDSLVLRTPDGRLLVRSAALRESLRRLGAPWSAVARLMALVPRRAADSLYDLVAARRARLFGRSPESCPAPPGGWRGRLLP